MTLHIPPPDREDGSCSWVHRALVLTGQLGLIAPGKLLPAWIALVAIASWPWQSLCIPAAVIATLILSAEWTMLALLPLHNRSWGPVTPSLLSLTLIHTILSWLGAYIAATPPSLGILFALQVILGSIAFYATWVEPFRLSITQIPYHVETWHRDPPLRILQITDIHFERTSPRETQMLAAIRQHAPDLILLVGDYLNLSSVYDPEAQTGVRALLSQLQAPLGVYAVTGSPVVDVAAIVPHIFDGLSIHWLDDEAVPIMYEGNTLWLMGVRCTYNAQRDQAALTHLINQAPPTACTILMYHTPDMMPAAAELGVDVYMAGHTHGGQIRIPIYGALATSSRWGKRYEMGMYYQNHTTLYVSRGLGMEGLGAPRARFLAPPEIILWEIQSTRSTVDQTTNS
ncbi:MAG: metallophosphoesterase [Anaerolineae bacterium]|nr:metallophosphoesterase [Anaerolineae bacterium]